MQYLSKILILTIVYFVSQITIQAAEMKEPLHPEWSFQGPLGKFERASLQRGYQVYTEVCSGCHSMELLSYRKLMEDGGPEFSESQVKAMAASIEVKCATDEYGDVVMRPAILSDKFVSPYENEQQGRAANGGAYPPDLSVMVKARHGGADYVYSLLLGYEDAPEGMVLDDGVSVSYTHLTLPTILLV